MEPAPLVAIATTLYLPVGRRAPKPILCSLTKWCHNAGLLARSLPPSIRAELIVLTNRQAVVRRECRARIILFDANVSAVVDAWASAHETQYARRRLKAATCSHYLRSWLRKWQLVGMIKYDAVFYTDTDVDLFAGAYNTSSLLDARGVAHFNAVGSTDAAIHAWTTELPAFLASDRTQLIATLDREIVVHGGAFLLRPSRRTFQAGLDVLRSRQWTPEDGFEAAGSPRHVCHHGRVGHGFLRRCQQTRFWTDDTWDVVAGNADQGLLTHIYLTSRRLGRGALRLTTYPNYSVHHFWGSSKPWLLKFTRCLRFWEFLDGPLERSVPSSALCVAWHQQQRRQAQARAPLSWPPCGGRRLFVF